MLRGRGDHCSVSWTHSRDASWKDWAEGHHVLRVVLAVGRHWDTFSRKQGFQKARQMSRNLLRAQL